MARPQTPGSVIVNLNEIIDNFILTRKLDPMEKRYDIDIVVPIRSSMTEKRARNTVFLLDNKMYTSQRSNFVEPLTTVIGKMKFYFYDTFKNYSNSHKRSYSEGRIGVYHTDGFLVLPYYWRID